MLKPTVRLLHGNKPFVPSATKRVALVLVECVRIGPMIPGSHDQHSCTALSQDRFGGLHQRPPDPAPPMIRRHGQCHDLPVMIVALVKGPQSSPDETHDPLVCPSDKRVVTFIMKYRLQPLAHLARRGSVAQVGDELSYSVRIGDRSVTDSDTRHELLHSLGSTGQRASFVRFYLSLRACDSCG